MPISHSRVLLGMTVTMTMCAFVRFPISAGATGRHANLSHRVWRRRIVERRCLCRLGCLVGGGVIPRHEEDEDEDDDDDDDDDDDIDIDDDDDDDDDERQIF